ncbi:hypothetical protein ACEQ6A_36275, partial [Rhizobium brockwellii]|uniref:hypothetical protein n=1 Tax=Rhizobium brockwellii TaxID=3019932 RepID=UPI003F97AB30
SNANSVSHAVGCRHTRLIEVAKGKITVEYFKGRGCQGPPLHVETVEKGEFFWFELPSAELAPTDFSARMTIQFVPEE